MLNFQSTAPAVSVPELADTGMSERQQLEFTRFRLWRVLIPICVWYSFFYLGRLNWGFCLPWIIKDLGISKLTAGSIDTVMLWSYAASALLSGRTSDKVGGRVMQLIGGVASTAFNVAISLQTSLAAITLFSAFNGAAQGSVSAPTAGMISQWYPRSRRGRAIGAYIASVSVAVLIVWLITGYTVSNFGWRAAFAWPPVLFVLTTTIALWLMARDRPEDVGLKPYIEATSADSIVTDGARRDDLVGRKAWIVLLRNPRFVAMCCSSFTQYIARYGLLTWVPLYYAETAGVQLKAVPAMTIMLPIGMIFGPLLAGVLSDTLFAARRFPAVIICFLGLIFVVCVIAYIPIREMGLPVAVLLQFLAGLFTLGLNGCFWAWSSDFGGRKLAGTAAGVLNFFNYAGAGIQGALIGGILTYSGGNWTLVFSTIASLLVIGGGLSWFARERQAVPASRCGGL